MPSIGNISRIYNFDNRLNGGLGPGAFLFKNNNQVIIKPIFDLAIYIILSNNIDTNLKKILQQITGYKITINQYLHNSNNSNTITNEIINEEHSKQFLILDNKISNNYKNLKITYKSIDTNNINIDNIIEYIHFMLFKENSKV